MLESGFAIWSASEGIRLVFVYLCYLWCELSASSADTDIDQTVARMARWTSSRILARTCFGAVVRLAVDQTLAIRNI